MAKFNDLLRKKCDTQHLYFTFNIALKKLVLENIFTLDKIIIQSQIIVYTAVRVHVN